MPVRGRVIARHVTGQSNRQIANEEKIDRDTVSRILTQREVVQMVAQYQSRLLKLVPKALGVYDQALASDDERVRVATATRILEGLQVLNKGGIEQTIDIANRAAPEMDGSERKRLILGEMTEILLEKKQRFAIPTTPELNALEAEAKRRAEED